MPFVAYIVLGVFFGSAAALAAFLISYKEYKTHRMGPKAMRLSLVAAAEAFAFFLIGACIVGLFLRGGV